MRFLEARWAQSWLGNQERGWVSQGHVSPAEDSPVPSCKEHLAPFECLTLSPTPRPPCLSCYRPRRHLSLPASQSCQLFLIFPDAGITSRKLSQSPRSGAPAPTPSAAAPGLPPSELLSRWDTSAVSLSGFLCPLRTRPRQVSSLNFQHQGLS